MEQVKGRIGRSESAAMTSGPRIVSDQAEKELNAERDARNARTAPRTVFMEAISPEKYVRVDICGEWDNDMAEALTNFLARRQRKPA